MPLGELLFLLLVLSSQVSCVALLLLLQLHKYLSLANKFIELYPPVFLQLINHFLLVQQTLNSLKNLPNISDLVLDSLCVVYHVRGQQFVDFKFFVDELLKVLSVPQLVNRVTICNDFFLKHVHKLAKHRNWVLFMIDVFCDVFNVVLDRHVVT